MRPLDWAESLRIMAAAGTAWLCAAGILPQRSPIMLFALLAITSGVIVLTAWESARLLGSWRWIVVSPLAVAALVWATNIRAAADRALSQPPRHNRAVALPRLLPSGI